jgi:hypothetical protein
MSVMHKNAPNLGLGGTQLRPWITTFFEILKLTPSTSTPVRDGQGGTAEVTRGPRAPFSHNLSSGVFFY